MKSIFKAGACTNESAELLEEVAQELVRLKNIAIPLYS